MGYREFPGRGLGDNLRGQRTEGRRKGGPKKKGGVGDATASVRTIKVSRDPQGAPHPAQHRSSAPPCWGRVCVCFLDPLSCPREAYITSPVAIPEQSTNPVVTSSVFVRANPVREGETEKTVFEFSGDVFHLRVWIDVEM